MTNVFALAIQMDRDAKFKRFLNHLAARWADEGDFEDLNDYIEVVRNSRPEVVKVLEEPFRVVFEAEGGFIEATPRGDDVEFALYVEAEYLENEVEVIGVEE